MSLKKWFSYLMVKVYFTATIGKIFRIIKNTYRRLILPPLESLPNAPELFRSYRHLYNHPDIVRKPGGWLYKEKFYPDYLTVGGASCAIFKRALDFCQGEGIDVGAGLWPLPGACPLDACHGPGKGRDVASIRDDTLDYVFSSHCLEHIVNWRAALSEWIRKLKPGGIIFLYLPHPECAIWHPGSVFVGNGHKWLPTSEVIADALKEFGCEIISRDNGPDAMYSFFICGKRIK